MSELVEREHQYYMQVARRQPVVIVKGEGSWVWDEAGEEYGKMRDRVHHATGHQTVGVTRGQHHHAFLCGRDEPPGFAQRRTPKPGLVPPTADFIDYR